MKLCNVLSFSQFIRQFLKKYGFLAKKHINDLNLLELKSFLSNFSMFGLVKELLMQMEQAYTTFLLETILNKLKKACSTGDNVIL